MSVTSGFFNSLNHDRRYNAQQFSAIFDGIINDGVFANIGAAFAIKADSGVTVTIDKGRAWFNSSWIYNDSLLPKTLEGSEVVLDRIDAVVIEVDHSEAVRLGDIKIVKGAPSSNPQRPTMANTANKHQHPLAYIYRKAGSTTITQADITNMVGTSSCPYVTGILQVQNIDNIVAQWEAQWNQWYAEKVADTESDASELQAEMKSAFDIWFADVKAVLDDDTATALAGKVAELQGKFDDLARESTVYDELEDSDLDIILGSDGTPLQGKTVFGSGGPVDAYTLRGHTPEDFRPSDWLPTIADIGAAPAGYGLGEGAPSITLTDCNDATKSGWYRTSGSTANQPLARANWMRVDAFSSTYLCQTWFNDQYDGCTVTRFKIGDNKWTPWEWVNPPMALGVEYRTTERWNGKPVYTMLINCGNMPTAGNTNRIDMPSTIYGWIDRVLRANGTDSSGNSIPYSWQGEYITEVSANRSAIYIYAKDDYSSNTADVQIWYVRHQGG